MRKMDADHPDAGFRQLDAEKALVYLQDQDLHYKDPDTEWDTLPEGDVSAKDTYFDLKSQIVGAWFNSEPIGTEVLAYLPVPRGVCSLWGFAGAYWWTGLGDIVDRLRLIRCLSAG